MCKVSFVSEPDLAIMPVHCAVPPAYLFEELGDRSIVMVAAQS